MDLVPSVLYYLFIAFVSFLHMTSVNSTCQSSVGKLCMWTVFVLMIEYLAFIWSAQKYVKNKKPGKNFALE